MVNSSGRTTYAQVANQMISEFRLNTSNLEAFEQGDKCESDNSAEDNEDDANDHENESKKELKKVNKL